MKNPKNFDYKKFLIEKGEKVGLGVAVGVMTLMILGYGISSIFGGGGSACGNQGLPVKLKKEADSMMVSGAHETNLGDHLKDLQNIERQVVDRDWFPCDNPLFG